MKKLSQSQELFYDLYTKMSSKIEESSETIFSGVSIMEHMETNYERFMESTYSKQFFLDESIYEKNVTIKAFIENEVLSDLYTSIYDHLLTESEDGELSFAQQYLMENTEDAFKVKYKGASSHQLEQFEESLATIAAIGGVGAMFGAVPAVAFGALTVIGMNLLFPSRYARTADMFFEKSLGQLGKVLFGTKSLLAYGNTSLTASNNNILNFDNIDMNPEVKKLFYKLSSSNDKNAPIQGINTIVATCLENNDALNAGEIDGSQKGFFRGKYSPRYNTIFTVFIDSLFKKSSSKNGEEYGTLIKYRRCLTEKLVDIYKFLMIANISQSGDYKKILRVMKRGFHGDPEQLLSFIHIEDDKERLNRDNIITLFKFRLFLEDMAADLKKGTFDVDRESSIYLNQKLNMVDREIEDYLMKNGKRLETVYESQKDFARKDFKHNKIPDKNLKRNLMGFSAPIKGTTEGGPTV